MKRELERFPKKYRRYFSDKTIVEEGCEPDSMSMSWPYDKGRGRTPNEDYLRYIDDIRQVYDDLEDAVYDAALKIVWLEHRLGYKSMSMSRCPADKYMMAALNAFMTKICMVYRGMFFPGRSGILPIVRRYAEELHQGFYDVLDPFKVKLKFPYQYMKLGNLAVVSDMDEAMALLDEAESKHMMNNEFLDFLASWVAGYSEKYGEKYQLKLGHQVYYAKVINLMDGGTRSEHQLLVSDTKKE